MSKVYNLAGKEITSSVVRELFTTGMPVYLIAHTLKVFQSDCLNLLASD